MPPASTCFCLAMSGDIQLVFIHGYHDIVALTPHALRLAVRTDAPCVLLNGGHFTPRENALEVSIFTFTYMTASHCYHHSMTT